SRASLLTIRGAIGQLGPSSGGIGALYRPPGRVYNTFRVALTVAERSGVPLAASGFPKESTVIEVFVESIRVNMTNYKRVVMPREKPGQGYLPIWIGHFEADAIAIPMQNVPVSRPLTHDLLGSVITSLGGKITQVVINELADETFYAKLIIDDNGRHVEVDSRPSDAIALAIRAKVPIFVEDAVL